MLSLSQEVSFVGTEEGDRRFLMIKQPAGEATAPQIIVVQHWLRDLKRLVPQN